MKLGNLKVARHPGVVVIVQDISADEQACFVSKEGSDTIEGRYLHEMAGAVADAQPKVDALVKAVAIYLLALDQGGDAKRMAGCLSNVRHALAQCGEPKADTQ